MRELVRGVARACVVVLVISGLGSCAIQGASATPLNTRPSAGFPGPDCTWWSSSEFGQLGEIMPTQGEVPVVDAWGESSNVRLVGPSVTTVVSESQGIYDTRAFTVQNDRLVLEGERQLTVKGGFTFTPYQYSQGHGWNSLSTLMDASIDRSRRKNGFLYGFTRSTGTLTRYAASEGAPNRPTVRSSASSSLFAGYRTMSFGYVVYQGTTPVKHVLLGETVTGALVMVSVPLAGPFVPRKVVLRSATWSFDDIATSPCLYGVALTARKGSTAYMYELDVRQSLPKIIFKGQMPGVFPLVHLSGQGRFSLPGQACTSLGCS